MRTLLRIFALAPLVLSSVGPATSGAATIGGTPSDAVSSIAGHYRCTASNGAVTERSYVVVDGGSLMSGTATSARNRAVGGARSSVDTPAGAAAAGTASVLRTVYGRQEGLDTGPTFERIVERSDHSLAVDSAEGTATAPAADASGMRFTGQESAARAVVTSEEAASGGTGGSRAAASRFGAQVASVARPLSFSYALEPSGLRRTVRSGSATLSDDRCARTRDVASANCATPNAAAAAAYAVVPRSPSGAPLQGSVQMHLVLDDRGRVVGDDVLSSSSSALTSAARFAARDSRFTAALQGCRAVSSQLVFNVQFSPDAGRSPLNNGRETNL
jgi:TonB-like protein